MSAHAAFVHCRSRAGAPPLNRSGNAPRARFCAEPRQRYAGMPEAHVCALWEQRAVAGAAFRSAEGREIRIVHAGHPNRHEGPDYLGARILVDGRDEEGDVEVHVREGDWRRHGHVHDPRFRGVLLHVVLLRERSPLMTSGMHTIVLPDILERKLRAAWASLLEVLPARVYPCADAAACVPAGRREAVLLLAAASRFARKQARVAARLGELAVSSCNEDARRQVLYELLARAFGYGGNEEAMESLAIARPLTRLNGGAADILQTFRSHAGSVPAAPAPGWHSRGVRPTNAVERRLAQLAACAFAIREASLLASFRHALLTDAAQLPVVLASACTGVAGTAPGEGRRTEILVNVIAPLYAVMGAQDAAPSLIRAATALYFHTPQPASNHKTRALAFLRTAGGPLDSTTQQGLIELHDRFCTVGRCASCLLSPS